MEVGKAILLQLYAGPGWRRGRERESHMNIMKTGNNESDLVAMQIIIKNRHLNNLT